MHPDGAPGEGDQALWERQIMQMRMGTWAVVAAAALGATPSAAPTAGAMAETLQHGAAARRDHVLRTATIGGRVTGMTMGDYLSVTIRPGRGAGFQAQQAASPADLFLDAHRNQPLTLQVQDVRRYIPEAGDSQ